MATPIETRAGDQGEVDMQKLDVSRVWVRGLCDRFDQLEGTLTRPSGKRPGVDWDRYTPVVKY